MRTMLDSIATRLDESRDTSRYLVGLLVFLGLLGTFWGLLGTIASIRETIEALDPGSGDAAGGVFCTAPQASANMAQRPSPIQRLHGNFKPFPLFA